MLPGETNHTSPPILSFSLLVCVCDDQTLSRTAVYFALALITSVHNAGSWKPDP